LAMIRQSMEARGFVTQLNPSGLLLIDLHPSRWEALLRAYETAGAAPFPSGGARTDVYELARLLALHPAPFSVQPLNPIRAAVKSIGGKGGRERAATALLKQCAERLRRKAPLPSALADILRAWLIA
jgi:hypothetical protein